ncbi:hypothetical protein FACS189468_8670 [Spirochaetia bacterium]|nr:hypothetical protein FACS189468_8670 [Spirochaetia bacterium]
MNSEVDKLNNWLKDMCSEERVLFLDVNQLLTINGALDEQYTYDGVHLLGNGYEKWRSLIESVLGNEDVKVDY